MPGLRSLVRSGRLGARSVVGPPDFVGVGAQRSGTSWWFSLLADHPQIAPPGGGKELHFFDAFHAQAMEAADIEAYHACFPRRRGQVAGEWTPRYMHDFWTPPLLRRAAPEAALLVLVRDPVERFRSGLAVERVLTPPRDDVEAARLVGDAMRRGRYAEQLRLLFEHWPRERVLVLQFERCVAEPLVQLRRTHAFLGVRPGHRPSALSEPVDLAPPRADVEVPAHVRDALVARLRDDVRDLAGLVPDLDLELWRNFRGAL